MVDVGSKDVTRRAARASGRIRMRTETLALIRQSSIEKGDVLAVARLAGIMAAKKTDELIPLCHSLAIDAIEVSFEFTASDVLSVEAHVASSGRTGVEMEALTAVSVAAMTVYDMCKSIDRGMVIEQVRLDEKSGGKSGHFRRPPEN